MFALQILFFAIVTAIFMLALLLTDGDHKLITRMDDALDRLHLAFDDWRYYRLRAYLYRVQDRIAAGRNPGYSQQTVLVTIYFDDPILGQTRRLDQIVWPDHQNQAVLVLDMIQLQGMFDRRQQTLYDENGQLLDFAQPQEQEIAF